MFDIKKKSLTETSITQIVRIIQIPYLIIPRSKTKVKTFLSHRYLRAAIILNLQL